MAQPQTGGPPGKYGYDSDGNLIQDQTPIQRTLAYILGALQALVALGGGGGGGGGAITAPLGAQAKTASVATVAAFRSPASSDVSVAATAGGTQIVAANATGQLVSISNNGLTPIWIDYGGMNPVADTSTATGIGRGIMLASGGLWESPSPITTAVKGIAQAAQTCSVRATVS